jgi:hypothetical protein
MSASRSPLTGRIIRTDAPHPSSGFESEYIQVNTLKARGSMDPTSATEWSFEYRKIPCSNNESKTEHTQKVLSIQLVTIG